MSWYPTKTIALSHRGQIISRVVAHDLDRVYLTDSIGQINVYYESDIIVDNKHLFVIGKKDEVVAKAIKLRKKK